MKQYGIYKGNRLLAKGIADDLAKDFNVVPQTIRSSARNNTMLQNTYIVREILEATTTLTDRQKEIIEEQFKSGKKVKEIAYNDESEQMIETSTLPDDVQIYIGDINEAAMGGTNEKRN